MRTILYIREKKNASKKWYIVEDKNKYNHLMLSMQEVADFLNITKQKVEDATKYAKRSKKMQYAINNNNIYIVDKY